VQERHTRTVQGRTRWRRFAIVTIPAVVAVGGIVFAMADGALAASFAVSGQQFKVSADKLAGQGFVQYGSTSNEVGATKTNGKAHPVAVAGIGTATITKMCQSVSVPGLPITLRLTAGDNGTDASATNLMFDMTDMQGDAVFDTLNIGQDASTLTGVPGATGDVGTFGQQAKSVTLTGVKQVAYAASAGTFTLPNLHLHVYTDGSGACF
jgi:hypothetical protein